MGKLVLVIIAALGLFFFYRHFNSLKKGEPTEDEFSKLLLQKASSLSFYISLYFWLVLSYFSDTIKFETSQIINYGIVGMSVIFVLTWLSVRFFGMRN